MYASGLALRGVQGDPHSALQLLVRSRHAFEAAPKLRIALNARDNTSFFRGALDHVVAKYSGLALMIYPYFIGDIWVLLAVGLGLLLLPKFLRL
jgi:hypothetical protein